ncbi:MAG: cysteine synthase A [Elusimicrobiota bacterium]
MKIYENISQLIGRTPTIKLGRLNEGVKNEIYAKLESFNPLHSVKDRTAYGMISDAFIGGRLRKGSTVVEATSGNTGISLAWLGASMGFKTVIVMPENMSLERRKIIKYFGGEIILTAAKEGMKGAVEKAKELSDQNGWFMPAQFENTSNVSVHYSSTGPEIMNDTGGKLDFFVCGVGTGGTLSGAGSYLKERIPNIKIIAVEPLNSPVLSGGERGVHKIQGIGAGFKPEILDISIIDKIIKVSDEDALKTASELAKKEGIFAGISSGAAVKAALEISKDFSGKKIAVILPDTAERYLSTELFS